MGAEEGTGSPVEQEGLNTLDALLFMQQAFVLEHKREPKCLYVGHRQYVRVYQDPRCTKYTTRLEGYNCWAFNGTRIIEVMADNHLGIA